MKAAKPLSPQQALDRAKTLCNRAEHCSNEILTKLSRWGVSASDAAKIIDILIDQRLIDDRRFAALYARDKMEYLGWGRRKIAMSLYVKRVAKAHITEALDSLDEDIYRRRLLELMRRKKNSLGPEAETYDGRTKIYRHALSRGFEAALAAQLMREI